MAPLSTNDGKESDHAVIHVCTELDQLHHFKKKILKVRPRTKAGEEKFKNLILTESWDDFLADTTEGPSVLAAKLEEITSRWMDICFPEKNLTIKSTDLPWINHEIKKKITNRKKEFKRSRNKRTELWHIMKAETDDMIKKAKKEYYDNMKCLAKSRDNPSLYYKAVARLKDAEKASQFDILDLFPGKTEEQAGSEIADFFNKITDNYTPLERTSHLPADPIVVQNYEVAAALKKFKKPKGLVACDIFPDLSTLYADILAIPLTRIFNEGFKRGEWPEIWRQETAVIIPKCRQPESMSDLRNLSCTPVYSKLMESFVLERIKKETKIRPSQYGGIKGRGTTHYLWDLWNEVLEGLEEKNSAIALMSIDFSKAFNSVAHLPCVQSLEDHGATNGTIAAVHGFLYQRSMRVKINQKLSDPLIVKGGCPQGTLLGNILFVLATNKLEDIEPRSDLTRNDDDPFPLIDAPTRDSEPEDTVEDERLELDNRTLRYEMSELSESAMCEEIEVDADKTKWSEKDVKTVKFIDDFTCVEKLFTPDSFNVFSTTKPAQFIRAKKCEDLYNGIALNGVNIGLKINCKKTQMVCISSKNDVSQNTYIDTSDRARITSQNSLKILGFHFGSRPTVDAHVTALKQKYRRRAWIMRHLKRAGINVNDLVKLYKVLLRPVLDYASPVYHPMLNLKLDSEIEALQRNTLKTIFGHELSYKQALELSGLQTLNQRRDEFFDKFVKNLSENKDFEHWLPREEFTGYNLRRELIYTEKFAKTDRLYKSPIYTARRRLNEIVKPELLTN